MLASELAPYAGDGDFASSLAGLCGELATAGHDVGVVMPYYRNLREGKVKPRKTGVRFSVPVGSSRLPCEIFEIKGQSGEKIFLVARDEYFDRSGIYGVDGRDYQDNAARFIFLTKCAVELARRMEPPPDIIHAHGWQTALASVFIRDQRLPFSTVLTPHGLEYQGNFWSYDFALTNLPGSYFSPSGLEYFGSMNCLKAGILFSDAIVLPGETFAAAAQRPRWGAGLDPVLSEQKHKLFGIPEDLNSSHWDPSWDKHLAAQFSAGKLISRSKNRDALLNSLGLDADPARGTFVILAAACAPDRMGAIFDGLDRLLANDTRLLVLGPLDASHERSILIASRKHAGRFAHHAAPDESLLRLALAGADFFLMPGPVEPSAAWLMRALRYGAVPVAEQCGGLHQFVRDFGDAGSNGFIYWSQGTEGVLDAARRAMKTYGSDVFVNMRVSAMESDFSRAAARDRLIELYQYLVPSAKAQAA